MNPIQKEFARILQEHRLVAKAEAFCASWQEGYIAQDEDGRVYVFNSPVERYAHVWDHSSLFRLGNARRLVASKGPAAEWVERCLPVTALQLPRPTLSPAQDRFLDMLLKSGIAGKIQAFLNSWQKTAWIGMDRDGTVCLYNTLPRKTKWAWICNDPKIGTLHPLASLRMQKMAWAECLVRLADVRQPARPPVTIDLPITQRADCWI